jgi:pilus assembly protein CpaE
VILADLPRPLDDLGRHLVALADRVVIATDLSLAGMRDTARLIGQIKALKPGAAPLVVAGRTGLNARAEVKRADFEKAIDVRIAHLVPYDAKAAAAMAGAGKPLTAVARSSKAAIEIGRLAEALAGRKAAPRPLLARLFG